MKDNVVNFKKDNVLVYGNPGTGKTVFVNKLILDGKLNEDIYLVNEYNKESNCEVFGSALDSLKVLNDFADLELCLNKMIRGEIVDSTLVIDSIYPYMKESTSKDLFKEFMSCENKNGNNLIVTGHNKDVYGVIEFDSYFKCKVDLNTGFRIITQDEVVA